MSLDEVLQKILQPHLKELVKYIRNNMLEGIVDMVLECFEDYNIPNKRDEMIKKVIEKFDEAVKEKNEEVEKNE